MRYPILKVVIAGLVPAIHGSWMPGTTPGSKSPGAGMTKN